MRQIKDLQQKSAHENENKGISKCLFSTRCTLFSKSAEESEKKGVMGAENAMTVAHESMRIGGARGAEGGESRWKCSNTGQGSRRVLACQVLFEYSK